LWVVSGDHTGSWLIFTQDVSSDEQGMKDGCTNICINNMHHSKPVFEMNIVLAQHGQSVMYG
jgi:hypothetical protein